MIYSQKLKAVLKRIRFSDNCWEWTGNRTHNGYPRLSFRPNGSTNRAHRFMYELMVGPIAPKMTLDHLCRVRHCVNPEHLEQVTQKENNLRGFCISTINSKKTHCLRGHSLHDAYLHCDARVCRICHKAKIKAQRLAKRSNGHGNAS